MDIIDRSYPPDNEENFLPAANILAYFSSIHTFIFDVDGVLTNGKVLITEKGELLRSMSMRDGLAFKMAAKEGYKILILTLGKSTGVIDRLRSLGISDIVWGIDNKLKAYEEFLDAYNLDENGILYMGDDLPDFQVLKRVGLPCCPQDAAPEILEIVKYISPYKGGEGCARDVIEKVMKLQGTWRI
jgi:3-deoxy-D-manno-octulosonate 8-phosphate phosphatase (KDO 8-P phosphatase)